MISAGSPAGPARPLVLVVEDEPAIRRHIAEALSEDYRVETAANGRQGLEKADALQPDLVLSDVMMPGLTGDRMFRELRARPALEHVPVILITSSSDEDLKIRMLSEGVQDYLRKPFEIEELRARVRNLVTMKTTADLLRARLETQTHDLEHLARQIAARNLELEGLLDAVREYAVFTLDAGGRIIAWNRGAERFYRFRSEEAAGRHVEIFYTEEERGAGAARQDLEEAAARGRSEVERWRVRKDGSRFRANIVTLAQRDDNGALTGFTRVTRDVTARRRIEETLRGREEEFAEFLENAAIPMHAAGPDGTILWANRAELELMGYAREEYVGHRVSDFHADRETIEECLRLQASGVELRDHPARLIRKDGRILHVRITSNVRSRDGRMSHTRCFMRDVTDHVLALQENLRLKEELHRAASPPVKEPDRPGSEGGAGGIGMI